MEKLATLRTRFDGAPDPPASGGSVAERVAAWVELHESFRSQLAASDPLFRDERREHLIELQARLRRLDERP